MKSVVVTVMGAVLWTAAVVLHTSAQSTGNTTTTTTTTTTATPTTTTTVTTPTTTTATTTAPGGGPHKETITCSRPSPTGCGSAFDFTNPQFPGLTVPVYNFTEQEKAGTCKRTKPGTNSNTNDNILQYANKSLVCVDSATTPNTLGDCICEDPVCKTCVENKTVADVESCCGSIKYFTYNGFKFPYFDDSTKKPTCCKAEGIDSKGALTSACYCEASTKECFNMCPAVPTGRIIGGTPVEPCGTGAVRIFNDQFVLCNGVYAYHPAATDKAGSKLTRPAIFVPKVCADGLDILVGNPLLDVTLKVSIGNTTFNYNSSAVTRTKMENPFFETLTFNDYTGPCLDKPVCTYNKEVMGAAINKSKCFLLSFGADSVDENGNPITSGNLNKLPIYQIGAIGTCQDGGTKIPGECFFPVNIAAFFCLGDVGAPIFCYLNTGEKVLYGSFAQTTACGPQQKLFPIIPFSP